MFSVYGLTGPTFRGSLEELRGTPGIPALHATRAVPRIGHAEDENATPLPYARPGARAINAYQQTLHSDLDRGPLYLASQIMQREVIAVLDQDDVAHAWQVLLEHHIHQAPVLSLQNRLVGIVSERNLLTALNVDAGRVRDTLARRVRDVMTSPVVGAEPDTDIRRIATVMLEHGVDGVPIVNEAEALVGFVSRSDILRAVITDPPLSLWR